MNTLFIGIVIFLIVLAIFDLVVGVSNDAVNFLNSAIGAKVASAKVIISIAAVGVFAGAAMSNGMMDVARHGIMMPEYFTFYDVMCVFLAVMITDVVLLDIFNSLGMPTSTTVSMVFELLGGAFAIALINILNGATDAAGMPLTLGDLLNTEKALSVILGIFLSVAVAFVLGTLVQWLSRLVFTFTYRVNGRTTDQAGHMGSLPLSSIKIGIFSGLAATGILWFLLINGLKGSSIMTPEVKQWINDHTWMLPGGGAIVLSALMTLLSALRAPVLQGVVLLGTFALAMAFAGNDLVNFVGVPLTGLDAYNDYVAHGAGDAQSFYMKSLMQSAQTPTLYLILAGLVMVLALIFSKKARNVVKTSVDLSRQDEGDEMFGSDAVLPETHQRPLPRTYRQQFPPCIERGHLYLDRHTGTDTGHTAPDGNRTLVLHHQRGQGHDNTRTGIAAATDIGRTPQTGNRHDSTAVGQHQFDRDLPQHGAGGTTDAQLPAPHVARLHSSVCVRISTGCQFSILTIYCVTIWLNCGLNVGDLTILSYLCTK